MNKCDETPSPCVLHVPCLSRSSTLAAVGDAPFPSGNAPSGNTSPAPSGNAPSSSAPGALAPVPWAPALRGKFIVFEGPDGSGKSTQLRRFVELITISGVGVCEVREPGGTKIGEAIRQVLLQRDHDCMTLRCEMLLYMASRAQLVEQRIRPALAQHQLVVADRFVTSTVAYQGAAQGLPYDEIAAAARIAVGQSVPDLVLVFDVDEETAAQRAGIVAPKSKGKRADSATSSLFADRMEDRTREFRRHVRQSYLDQAQADQAHFRVINAANGPDEVWRSLVDTMEKWALGLAAPGSA